MCPPICLFLHVVFFATPSVMIQFICAPYRVLCGCWVCTMPQTPTGTFFLGPVLCRPGGQKTHRFVHRAIPVPLRILHHMNALHSRETQCFLR